MSKFEQFRLFEFEMPDTSKQKWETSRMSITVEDLSKDQAAIVRSVAEGQFSDVKSIDISPAKLSKAISAFANADGGDLYVGIDEAGQEKVRTWRGFSDEEAANGHLQCFDNLFPLGSDFQYEFLTAAGLPGLVLHIQISKTLGVVKASNGIPYIRRGAASQPCDNPECLKRLEYAKGIGSFETELVNISKDHLIESEVIKGFIRDVVPTADPEPWLKKQALVRQDKPIVAGVLLFTDEPQALIPKHCGIKIYRYKTRDVQGSREALAFTPVTVEGCLYQQIRDSVRITTEVVESIPKMGNEELEAIAYPPEALHEIITNAVLHRDYSIADDIHIRVFDNRVEVQSPGRLPAHVTVKNILDERFARNGAVVRILNKFKDPPNKDVGEGLNTAFAAMHKLGLREPSISETENAVLVTIKHEPLASPEEAIMDYLATHETIRNREAREITHISADYRIKTIFGRMVDSGLIEQVPETRTGGTRYRKVIKSEPDQQV